MKRNTIKRKLGVIAACSVLAIATMVPAFATDIVSDTASGSTPVNATVDATYTVMIPDSITIDENEAVTPADHDFTVQAENVFLASGKTLQVALGNTAFHVVNTAAASEYISYAIEGSDGTSYGVTDTIATFNPAGAVQTKNYKLTDVDFDNAAHAGTYQGNLTFNISVV